VNATVSRARILAATAAALAVPRRGSTQTLEKIRFVGVQTEDMTPIYYAMRNGAFKKAGIDLEIVPNSSGSAATAAVVAGTYEMGKGSALASLIAHLRNLPLAVVANGTLWDQRKPLTLAMVANDSPIQTAADLNGKIGGTAALHDIAQLGIVVWVDKNGGDSKSMKWVELPSSAGAPALLEHRVDVASLNEPLITAARETGKIHSLPPCFNAIAERFSIGFHFANADWAAKHQDVLRRYVRVLYESATYTNAHPDETAPMMAEVTKMSTETIRKMSRAPAAATSDAALIQPVIDVAARYGYIARSFPASELMAFR
jgi:NitT/TauT family transport system substrate-binding protein